MLATEKKNILTELVSTASHDELIWINGFVNGILTAKGRGASSVTVAPVKTVGKITLLYGTETGNAKSLATKLATQAKQKGFTVKLAALDQYRITDLVKEENIFIVISTQGDGEPPAGAQKFYDYIHESTLDLKKLKYAVLALGDTSYPMFCKAGEDVDTQLLKHGANRITSMQKCDVDYEADATTWFNATLQLLNGGTAQTMQTIVAAVKAGGKKKYKGTVLSNVNLNDTGSSKETYHIEIGAEDISYLPGDSLSIVPTNPAKLVAEIVTIAGADGSKDIVYKDEQYTIIQLLTEKVNISYLPERIVAKYAAIVQQEIPATKIGLLDLLKIYPVKNDAQFEEVLAILETIMPRQYSISSAPSAHDGEVHLTVARDRFYVGKEQKVGLCSDYLSQMEVDREFTFSVHPNNQFRLPEEDKDVIMIGPGTGIAPFRSFLAERDATGASGRNWLFFGDQHFVSDFLYQSEIQSWAETGLLTKVNVAFSRDQKEKVYVQHKILANSEEFYSWIEGGAYIYICGVKEPMSVDVENTIVRVIAAHGDKTLEEATAYLQTLKDENRFLKDVY